MIGDNLDMDTANSVLMKADDQVEIVHNFSLNFNAFIKINTQFYQFKIKF